MGVTMKKIIFIFLILPLAVEANCLDKASEFAEKICGKIVRDGQKSVTKADGKLNAEVDGMFTRIFGEAGGEGKYSKLKSEYENVIHSELGDELKDARKCRQKMALVALEKCPVSTVNYEWKSIENNKLTTFVVGHCSSIKNSVVKCDANNYGKSIAITVDANNPVEWKPINSNPGPGYGTGTEARLSQNNSILTYFGGGNCGFDKQQKLHATFYECTIANQ